MSERRSHRSPSMPSTRWKSVLSIAVGLLSGCTQTEKLLNAFEAAPAQTGDVLNEGEAALMGGAAPPSRVGQTAKARDYELTISEFGSCDVGREFAPPPGVARIGVRLRVKGITSAQVPVNPFYGQLQSPDGRRYEAVLAGCSPAITAGQVSDQEELEGWISFDVPDGLQRELMFSYLPVVLGVGVEEARFALQ